MDQSLSLCFQGISVWTYGPESLFVTETGLAPRMALPSSSNISIKLARISRKWSNHPCFPLFRDSLESQLPRPSFKTDILAWKGKAIFRG